MTINENFTFEISLSVLNHLGRNLYRSFMTVLGEAISNSWDADAENVWIYIDRDDSSLVIKDDGKGMDRDDFQGKFLKIGYSKRKSGKTTTEKGRPFIGRKGIGKLALLSCAAKITVLSKMLGQERYIGGVIDNSGLTEAIKNDLTPDEYLLGQPNPQLFENYIDEHEKGTILYFESINDGIRNRVDYIKKLIALYFRFSLLDENFNIFVNGEKITLDHLNDLANRTEFAWVINDLDDPYVTEKLLDNSNLKFNDVITSECGMKGFIASVQEPKHLKVISTKEKASVDLFVNGRLREKNIFKHIPTARIVESYLYGQIHFDELDGEVDRFTSSREGIVANDPKFQELLEYLQKVLSQILRDWDKWRIELREDGDPENTSITKRERKSRELFSVVSKDFDLPKGASKKKKVNSWVEELANDAQFNFSSYAECFISENLIRKYIQDQNIPLSPEAERERDRWKEAETRSKNNGNISIQIRQLENDLGYLSMSDLAYLVDKRDRIKEACLARDADEYKPMRDALAHTALLTDVAKHKLTTVYENIKGRIKSLLSE